MALTLAIALANSLKLAEGSSFLESTAAPSGREPLVRELEDRVILEMQRKQSWLTTCQK